MIVLLLVTASSGKGAGWLPNFRTSLVEVSPAPSASNSTYRAVAHSVAMFRFVPMLSSMQALVRGPLFGSGGSMKSSVVCGLALGVRVTGGIVWGLGGVVNPARGALLQLLLSLLLVVVILVAKRLLSLGNDMCLVAGMVLAGLSMVVLVLSVLVG